MAMDVIPAVDLSGGRVVRLLQGDFGASPTSTTTPEEAADRFARAGARWLHVIDLDAARDGERSRRARGRARAPRRAQARHQLQVGGGFRTADPGRGGARLGRRPRPRRHARAARARGVRRLVARHGARICLTADALEGTVRVAGWLEDSGEPTVELVRRCSTGRESARSSSRRSSATARSPGPDLRLLEAVRAVTTGTLIASGGVGSADDVRRVAEVGCDAIVIGRRCSRARSRCATRSPPQADRGVRPRSPCGRAGTLGAPTRGSSVLRRPRSTVRHRARHVPRARHSDGHARAHPPPPAGTGPPRTCRARPVDRVLPRGRHRFAARCPATGRERVRAARVGRPARRARSPTSPARRATSIVPAVSGTRPSAENQILRQRNAQLTQQAADADNLRAQLNFTKESTNFGLAAYRKVAADVQGRSPGLYNSRITISAGSADGVRKNDAVVTGPGWLVGHIGQVSAHASEVVLINDPGSQVSASVPARTPPESSGPRPETATCSCSTTSRRRAVSRPARWWSPPAGATVPRGSADLSPRSRDRQRDQLRRDRHGSLSRDPGYPVGRPPELLDRHGVRRKRQGSGASRILGPCGPL